MEHNKTKEIVFRGFCLDESGQETIFLDGKAAKGKWVVGYLFQSNIIIPAAQFLYYAKYGDKKLFTEDTTVEFYIVEPRTIGQYSRCCERKMLRTSDVLRVCAAPTKIFEGDVIHCWGGVSEQGYWEYDRKFVLTDITDYMDMGMIQESNYIEVIGNVWENPKLVDELEEANSKNTEYDSTEIF